MMTSKDKFIELFRSLNTKLNKAQDENGPWHGYLEEALKDNEVSRAWDVLVELVEDTRRRFNLISFRAFDSATESFPDFEKTLSTLTIDSVSSVEIFIHRMYMSFNTVVTEIIVNPPPYGLYATGKNTSKHTNTLLISFI